MKGVTAGPLIMDVAVPESIKDAFRELSAKGSSIDILVNNAGILLDEDVPLLGVRSEVFVQTLHTNALGALFVAQAGFSAASQLGRRRTV